MSDSLENKSKAEWLSSTPKSLAVVLTSFLTALPSVFERMSSISPIMALSLSLSERLIPAKLPSFIRPVAAFEITSPAIRHKRSASSRVAATFSRAFAWSSP
ncbi:MAG: hypothetical protein BWY84_00747 [Candidatus Aerophobetes bacterium ADurb.Bin490]|nr:MAG: hypothetical protein BWY84_00747 [Candidatus Aerophobetes bacterium ADurb.Bin490]